LNGPNAAGSIAPTLIRHWLRLRDENTIVRLLAQPVIGIFCKVKSSALHALLGRLVTDIAVYNGPGDDGAAVQERGRVPGHDSRGAQVSLTARQATADV